MHLPVASSDDGVLHVCSDPHRTKVAPTREDRSAVNARSMLEAQPPQDVTRGVPLVGSDVSSQYGASKRTQRSGFELAL